MYQTTIYPIGSTEACRYAAELLEKAGISVTDHPSPEVSHLLLDVPSFQKDGTLRDGSSLESKLSSLPEHITLIGGNLPAALTEKYNSIDLLQDESYLAENAAITAECAIMLCAARMHRTYRNTDILVIGWGRIGKHLAHRLHAFGANVTVATRSSTHMAEIHSFGLNAIKTEALIPSLSRFSVIFNTAPQLSIPEEVSAQHSNCIKIELASLPGIAGSDVVTARGLPGKFAPESSGELIAGKLLQMRKEGKL